MIEPINRFSRLLLAALFGITASALTVAAWAQTNYYQGKTLTIMRGGTPGGYGDLQARALIPFLKKYIPGEPTVIIEHKQGAAGRTAINYIYSGAKPDGLTIGAVGNVLVSGPILGLAGTNYDLDKLVYLGSTDSGSPTAFVTRKEAGFDSVEKLRAATGIRIGANSVGHITYINGRLAAYLIGLKEPKFVVGYSSRSATWRCSRAKWTAAQCRARPFNRIHRSRKKCTFTPSSPYPKAITSRPTRARPPSSTASQGAKRTIDC